MKPFLEHLHAACKDNFNCGKNITIDKAMIPYKGKLSIKQRILGKPVHWRIKLFPLCDSETAYVSRFEVYLGKARDNENTSAIGKGGAVVARLTNDFHHKGHCLFVDNWYSSLALCIFLKSGWIYLCGTTRSNRRGYPAELKAFRAPAQNRGASSLRVYQGVVAFVSKDSKPVHFLSTAHYPDEVATVQGQQKERRSGRYSVKEVESHKIVVDYNANMGAVDTNEQMTTVRKSRKQLRWYMRRIVKFLEISAYNSYIIEGHFKEHLHERQRKRDFTAFREDLIHELVGHWRTEKARRGRKRKETPFRLENVGEHFPVKGAGSDHTCQVCREKRRRFMANSPDVPKAQVPLKLTKTTFKCEVCDVYLCISRENNCFQSWPP